MSKKIAILSLACLLASGLYAQNWRKLSSTAEQQLRQGNYAEAAENYKKAWQKKNKKMELIYQAGEAWYTIRDYRNAADAYQHVKDKNEEFPLVGLKYARSLKQDGQYDKASQEFKKFLESYSGQGKAILEEIVQTEIKGCELGLDLPSRPDRSVEVSYPGANINSRKSEFAPFPMSDDLIYFSSSQGDRARIYNSQKQGKTWTKAGIPASFPVIQNGHFGNGSLTPDGERFYFTICNADQPWNDLNTRCEIFAIKKTPSGWSQPERLPDYINMNGVTATHPYATQAGGQEILFFASNRDGGRGGLDLWYVTRDMGTNDNDFTFPVNLGGAVNTLGDEVSPFYDIEEDLLYFASNGHISIGGFDIFKTRGSETNWTVPENAGLPLNSSADDMFYVKNKSGFGGFFVSNRVSGGDKTDTRDGDIFEFSTGGSRITLKANVYDKTSGEILSDVNVTLYQVFEDGTENLLINKNFPAGAYLFELLPNRTFRVEVTRDGYLSGTYQFATNDPDTYTYGQPLTLDKVDGGAEKPDFPDGGMTDANTNKPPKDKPADNKGKGKGGKPAANVEVYTARGISEDDNLEYTTSAPKNQGTYYKIQLAALKNYEAGKFGKVKSLGRLDTEELVGKDMTRILLADFFTADEAKKILSQVHKQKDFGNAFIVEYRDGVRYGKVNLD